MLHWDAVCFTCAILITCVTLAVSGVTCVILSVICVTCVILGVACGMHAIFGCHMCYM